MPDTAHDKFRARCTEQPDRTNGLHELAIARKRCRRFIPLLCRLQDFFLQGVTICGIDQDGMS